MKATWQVISAGGAGVALLVGASAASQAHRVGLALVLCAAAAFLLALVLWTSGRSR